MLKKLGLAWFLLSVLYFIAPSDMNSFQLFIYCLGVLGLNFYALSWE